MQTVNGRLPSASQSFLLCLLAGGLESSRVRPRKDKKISPSILGRPPNGSLRSTTGGSHCGSSSNHTHCAAAMD